MIGKLLSREECAKCRLCCCFDSYDLWETPIIEKSTHDRIISGFRPDQEFLDLEDHYLLKMQKEPDRDLYYCSLLDHDKGCIMGTEKPFDCRIWPFRVMDLNGTRVIALSTVCPVVQTRPLCEIQAVAKELAPQIFAYADRAPFAVKKYISGYPIMVAEEC
ncbi:hypothetical protein [Ruminococcus albus]|uniref:Uncharacterized protein n=1 Tax=Ruminococcus albus SY3 TaxID=1341156 RepID=A0A011W1W4_RUMAL|nr:hypothetical protein [Ruminococcus albus]EXM40828.1 hypothetical protein RASY3_03830 [Ruminococcus albus SY3]